MYWQAKGWGRQPGPRTEAHTEAGEHAPRETASSSEGAVATRVLLKSKLVWLTLRGVRRVEYMSSGKFSAAGTWRPLSARKFCAQDEQAWMVAMASRTGGWVGQWGVRRLG